MIRNKQPQGQKLSGMLATKVVHRLEDGYWLLKFNKKLEWYVHCSDLIVEIQ